MPRLTPIDPARAEGKAKALLDGVQKAFGRAPNLLRTMAHSPAALQAHLDFGKALGSGVLDAKTREAIALAVAGENGCEYCASAHTAIGGLLGVDAAELAKNLAGRSGDPKVAAILRFARAVIAKRGWVSDADLRIARLAGVGDAEITEVVAVVADSIFTNYFNHVAETEVDFPPVGTDRKAAA
ncbi:MAG: carboxymuconolactone decarboxylase family protein [Rhodospirillales bacterium]|nr:carboxymuconolactone decarboxylase family protein [Rhodospirillales bacterium]